MARTSPRRSTGRRSPWAAAALIGIGLLITGGVYAGASAAMAATTETTAVTALTVDDGKKLFQANCATCHGLDLQGTDDGPSLYGVGELAVEFQVATGRMPMAMQGPQAPQKPVQFTQDQIDALAAYVQTHGAGADLPRRGGARRRGRRRPRRGAVPHQLRDVPQRRGGRRRAHRGQVRPGAARRPARCTCTRRWSPARRTCPSSTT